MTAVKRQTKKGEKMGKASTWGCSVESNVKGMDGLHSSSGYPP